MFCKQAAKKKSLVLLHLVALYVLLHTWIQKNQFHKLLPK